MKVYAGQNCEHKEEEQTDKKVYLLGLSTGLFFFRVGAFLR